MKIVAGKEDRFEHDYMLLSDCAQVLMYVNFETSHDKKKNLKTSEKKIVVYHLKQAVEEIKRLRNQDHEHTKG